MSFPAYDIYHDSGIDWLGAIPVGWTVKSMKRIASIQYGIGEPPRYQEEGTRLIRATNVSHGTISDEGMVYVNSTDIPEQRIVWLGAGDIIVVRSGAYTGDSAIIPHGYGAAIAGFDMVMRIHTAVPQFVQYALLSNYVKDNQLDLMRMRAAQPHLNAEELGGCVFVAPPIDEQKAISSFLDAETSKIDGLVSEQRRLIELLKEKRQAVISHAVTKGLNPNAPMKPSGIQWLGDVPEHWEAQMISRFAIKITNGYVGPTRDILVEDGLPYIQATHIKNGGVNFDGNYHVTQEWSNQHQKSILALGDVLIVQTGAGTGDVGLVSEDEVGFNCHALIIVQCDQRHMLGSFLAAALQSQYGVQTLESIQTGGMHPHLNCSNVKYVYVPTPPVEEQEMIVAYVNDRLQRFSKLQTEAERAIELLQERRTALISAAVTGKIDVRGFALQEAV